MPGLIAFNRRWGIGGDDLVFPEAAELFVRTLWLIGVAIVFNIHQDSFDCVSGYLVNIYYIGNLVLTSLNLILCIVIIYTSMQGGITEVTKRRHIAKLIYVKMALFLPELAWLILGTYWAFKDPTNCSTKYAYMVIAVKIMVALGWVMFLVVIIGVMIVFDPMGSRGKMAVRLQPPVHGDREASSAAQRLWKTRCKVICCCAAYDEQSKNAFNDISQMFTDFFEGMDLVPTDIASGLILVQEGQKSQPQRLQLEWVKSTLRTQVTPGKQATGSTEDGGGQETAQPGQASDVLVDVDGRSLDTDPEKPAVLAATSTDQTGEVVPSGSDGECDLYPNPKSWMNINMASYYMRFAMASYGWPLYMYMNLPMGCCKLARDSTCCQCTGVGDHIDDDNCCRCNTSAIRMITTIDEEDIIFASYHNKVYEIPFYVALDHQNSAVVVAIRGTLSLRDALTDMTAESERLEVPGLGSDSEAHKGILRAARYIQDTLNSKQVLEKAYERGQGFQLVIAGHSLGAGAAAILSILLRPKYPDLICYAFSPPGGLLSMPLSRYCEDFVCSVVVGEDLVPRLSLATMDDLKIKLLRVIRNSTKPKYMILAGGCWNAIGSLLQPGQEETPIARPLLAESGSRPRSYSNEVEIEIKGQEAVEVNAVQQDLDDAIMTSSQSRMSSIPLYPPGHILFIQESRPVSTCCGGTPDYEAAWARAEVFDEIIVSPKMVADHVPDVVCRALDQLADRDYAPRHRVILRNSPNAQQMS